MDDLIAQMTETKVDPAALGEHPRYSQYKNVKRAAEQQVKRREEYWDQREARRQDDHSRMRKLAFNQEDSDEEGEETQTTSGVGQTNRTEGDHPMTEEKPLDLSTGDSTETKQKKYKSRYADELMLSEWLVDIPDELSDCWIMLPSPVGKRCLVVCNKNLTTAYMKNGKIMHQFQSNLPSKGGNFTILDCILVDNMFYCIDVLAWAGQVLSDNPFDFRRFFLNSKIQENEILQNPTSKCKFSFRELPQCPCSPAAMEGLMAQDFPFILDGLLFYHSQVMYERGQNPLVGWLKPWMLPDILGVQIPQKYHAGNKAHQTPSQFIDDFNSKHGHVSKIDKADAMAH